MAELVVHECAVCGPVLETFSTATAPYDAARGMAGRGGS